MKAINYLNYFSIAKQYLIFIFRDLAIHSINNLSLYLKFIIRFSIIAREIFY
jgi:hypothetical protein